MLKSSGAHEVHAGFIGNFLHHCDLVHQYAARRSMGIGPVTVCTTMRRNSRIVVRCLGENHATEQVATYHVS